MSYSGKRGPSRTGIPFFHCSCACEVMVLLLAEVVTEHENTACCGQVRWLVAVRVVVGRAFDPLLLIHNLESGC